MRSRLIGSAAKCTKFRLQPTVDGSWAVQSYVHGQQWLTVAPGGHVMAASADPRGVAQDAARFELVETGVAATNDSDRLHE